METSFRLRRRQRQLAAERRLLMTIDDRDERPREVERQILEVTDAIRHHGEDETKDTKQLPDPKEYQDWVGYLAASVVTWFGDVLTHFWMTVSAGFSVLVSALVALFMACGVPCVVHIMARHLLVDRLRVDRTKRLHIRTAAGAGVAVAVGALWFAAFRGLDPESAGAAARFGWVPFVLVAVSAPIVVGSLSSLAGYLWSFSEAQKRRFERRRLVEDLREYLKLLERMRNGNGAHGNLGKGRGAERGAGVLVHSLTFLLAASGFVGAARADGGACVIGLDSTASVDLAGRAAACARVEAGLEGLIGRFGCRTVVLAAVTDEGPFTEREVVRVSDEAKRENCSEARPEGCAGVECAYEVFPNVRIQRKREAESRCRTRQERLVEERAEELGRAAARLRRLCGTPVAPAERGTALSAFVEAAVSLEPQAVVLITDGLEQGSPHAIAVPEATSVVMVLVPGRPPYGSAAETVQAASRWRRRLPRAWIFFHPELHPEIWQELGRGGEGAARRGMP